MTNNVLEHEAASQTPLTALLFSISKTMRALMGVKLADLSLHNGQDELLLAIQHDPSLPVTVVADQLNVRPSTVTKMADRLVERGLVVRATDGADARRRFLQITPTGQEVADRVLALHEAVEADLLRSLTSDTDATLEALAEADDLLTKRLRRLR